jgi:energy-coupling factor transport system ATP-binding protein
MSNQPVDEMPSFTSAVRVTADGWGWRHSGRKDFALRDVIFTIEPGERVLLLGASGAGKSTLMAAMAGVLGGDDEGESEGSLLIDDTDATAARGRAGLVMQDPDSQTILARLGDDVAFGCENLGIAREETWSRVRHALAMVGLGELGLDHSTSALSGGQRQRLALAGALAMRPGLLLLDEPTANLDPEGVTQVRDAVRRVLDATGETMVVVEHHVNIWLPVVSRVIVVGEGGVIADGAPDEVFGRLGDELAAKGTWVPGRPLPDFSPRAPRGEEPVLKTHDLGFGRDGESFGRGLNLDFYPGEITALMGPNGAGKTTLALTLAGLLAPTEGNVEFCGADVAALSGGDPVRWHSRELLGRIGMVMQEPEHQFVTPTVLDEVMVGPCSMGHSGEQAHGEAEELLEQLGLARFGPANPFTLSGGEKRRLSVASMLAAAPEVVVMDEPTFGQDFTTWTAMARLIARIRDEGKSVILVTHDEALVRVLGAREVMFAQEAVASSRGER